MLAAELASLGAAAANTVAGGVEFDSDLEGMYRAHLWSGLASHIRVRAGRFEARHFSALAKQAKRIDWTRWIPKGAAVAVRASSKRSKLYHTGGIEQRVRESIDAAVGGISDAEDEAIVVHARVARDRCELSIDTSGAPMHRRGWRLQTAKAPLREDLAHALIRASGWDPTMTLIDPMMGSGTIVIEAARIARRIAPGRDRHFAFESMPGFDAQLWRRLNEEAVAGERAMPVRVVGRDRDRGALEATKGNAERAGVLDDLELEQRSLQIGDLDGFEAAISNPPYGKRVQTTGPLRAAWTALGDAIAAANSVRRVALVVPDRSLLRHSRLRLEPKLLTDHGGLKVEFMVAG